MIKEYGICGVGIRFSNISKSEKVFFDSEWQCLSEASKRLIDVSACDYVSRDDCTLLASKVAVGTRRLLFYPKSNAVEISWKSGLKISYERGIAPFHLFWVLERLVFLLLPLERKIFLHASCLSNDGGVQLTSGCQGAGKSKILHEALSSGARYLGDDLTIVNTIGDAFYYSRRLSVHQYLGSVFSKLLLKSPKSWPRYLCYRAIQLLGISKKFTLRARLSECYEAAPLARKRVTDIRLLNAEGGSLDFSSHGKSLFLSENISREFLGMFYEDWVVLGWMEGPLFEDVKVLIHRYFRVQSKIANRFVCSVEGAG